MTSQAVLVLAVVIGGYAFEFLRQNRHVFPIRWRLWRTRRYAPPYDRGDG